MLLFYGDEEYLIKQRINKLKAEIANPDLNVDTFDANECEPQAVIQALQSQSLLGGNRLVVVRNLDLKSKLCQDLLLVLETIPSNTESVFWADKVDKRSKFYKLIDQIGEVYEFRSFAPWEQDQVISFIKQQVESFGKKIDQAAAEMLFTVCGQGLRNLVSEVDKLITYIGERSQIEANDIYTLASPGEVSIFAFVDAMGEKSLKKALSAFRLLYKNKVDPFQMLSLLASQYRIMLYTKSEKNPQKTAQELGTSPFFVKKCMQRESKFSEDELRDNLEALLQADLDLKTGKQHLATLEVLIASLCGK